MKKTLILTAAMLIASSAAFAGAITVDNYSFELKDVGNAEGADGDMESWTTGGTASPTWTTRLEGRTTKAGPTQGDQDVYLAERSEWDSPANIIISSTSIGTGSEIKAEGDTLEVTFDARLGAMDGGADGVKSWVNFYAYLTVDGVKNTEDDMSTAMGVGTSLRTWAVINADTGENMDEFTISMDATGLSDSAVVKINFELDWTAKMGAQGDQVRVFVDDVQAEGVPEPATMSLLAVGGIALLRRKRR